MNGATRSHRRNLKFLAAAIGVLGGVSTVTFGVALDGGPTGFGQEAAPPAITTGETVTATTAPSEPQTPDSSPTVSATTPSGFATPH